MRISELPNAPTWLKEAKTFNADVNIVDGVVIWLDGTWLDGSWHGGIWRDGTWITGSWRNGTWHRGRWHSGTWYGGSWLNGTWRDGTWHSGTWYGGRWQGGTMFIGECKVDQFRVYTGLYKYPVMVYLFTNGSRWVRMDDLLYSLEELERIGVRNSNLTEFPDDKSAKSEERVRAFEFARTAVLSLTPTEEADVLE